MAKQIVKVEKVDLDISAMSQLIDRMGNRLGNVWHELDGKPEAQAAIVAVWEQVQQLGKANDALLTKIQLTEAALDKATEQRDKAIFDVKAFQKYGIEMSQQRLAAMLSIATHVPLPDVERVLDVVLGDKTTFEENALAEFFAALGELANTLYVEQMYNRYADEETEEFEADDFEEED